MTVAVPLAKDWSKAPVSLQKISLLVLDWSLYPRKEVDQQVVMNYAIAMQAGCVFPPVKIALLAGKMVVADGFHRINARKKLKQEYIDCAILPFSSNGEFFAEAVRLNSGHGKNFSEAEIKANIKRLQKFKFNVKDIQSIIHVPVAQIHREAVAPIATLTAPCGKKFHVDSGTGRLQSGADYKELLELKGALMLFCNVAESGRFPRDDPNIKSLTLRAKLDFARLCFDV